MQIGGVTVICAQIVKAKQSFSCFFKYGFSWIICKLVTRFLVFSLFLFVFVPHRFGFSWKELVSETHKGPLKKTFKVNNDPWNQWLRSYVKRNGQVNYKKGKKDIIKIQKYVQYLLSIDSNSLKTKSAQLAYYLNLYNSVVIYGVLRHYPIKSVKKIKNITFFRQRLLHRGKKITINQLESDYILAKFKEPLVHFALNCASYSCPPLKNKAYTGHHLKKQLVKQTKAYLKNKEFIRIKAKKKIFYVIELFKWYKKDLGDPIKFYKKYDNSKVDLSAFEIKYIPYNWSLNSI